MYFSETILWRNAKISLIFWGAWSLGVSWSFKLFKLFLSDLAVTWVRATRQTSTGHSLESFTSRDGPATSYPKQNVESILVHKFVCMLVAVLWLWTFQLEQYGLPVLWILSFVMQARELSASISQRHKTNCGDCHRRSREVKNISSGGLVFLLECHEVSKTWLRRLLLHGIKCIPWPYAYFWTHCSTSSQLPLCSLNLALASALCVHFLSRLENMWCIFGKPQTNAESLLLSGQEINPSH